MAKKKAKATPMETRVARVEARVKRIEVLLEQHQITVQQDVPAPVPQRRAGDGQ